MKHKKIVFAVLAMSMLVSSASNLMFPVLATTSSDIEISTDVSTDTDVVIESSGNDIVIETESDEDIVIEDVITSDTESIEPDSETDISISNTENTESTEDVEISESDDIEIESDTADDITESKVLLDASVSKNDKKNILNTGVSSVLTVKAENNSDKTAVFKVYFTNLNDDLSEDKSEWSEYLTQPALYMQVKGLDDDCNLSVNVLDVDGNTTETTLSFLKEVKDDEIVSRYARMELPASTSTEFDLTVYSDKNSTVTLIPVMEQNEAVYGEDTSVTWKKKLNFFDKFIQLFTGEDEENDEIEISDVQGVEMNMTGMEDTDFSSMRLVILTDDASVITDTENIIGTYGNIYLMQYGSVQETKNAYIRYKDKVDAIEPDKAIETATNSTEITVSEEDEEKTDETDITESSVDDIVTTDGTYDETQNPLVVLNEVDGSDVVQNEQGVIAVIDTGASEHANVIDRVSVIDDVLSGSNLHGDIMVKRIVSQNSNAKILSIRALNDNGFGTISSLVAAMEYAIEQDVDYINLSLYARATLTTSVLKQEIAKAIEAGIIVIGAAGNDGVDVKDYVPGSVEEAYIIGSATTDGFKHVLSNYGDTVDYNVVAESTSEATALFTGYISAHGLDSISDVLNQGLIYATDFASDDDLIIDTTKDIDFSEYEVDTTKKVITKYTFANANKLSGDETLASFFATESCLEAMYSTLYASPEVYAVGDGTYKVKLNAPLISGYATADYLDAVFARGNDDGEVVVEGVSIDLHTGIATIDESAFEGVSDTDFADLQIQVLAPVGYKTDRVVQDIIVESNDGSEYMVRIPVYGLQIETIPLSIEGTGEEITVDDFEVYINNEKTPVPTSNLVWEDDTHSLRVLSDYSALVHTARVVVKEDIDSVFKISAFLDKTIYDHASDGKFNWQNGMFRTSDVLFYLPAGTDVSDLLVDDYMTMDTRIGSKGSSGSWAYPNQPGPSDSESLGVMVTVYGRPDGNDPGSSGLLDYADNLEGYIGIPRNLFSSKIGDNNFRFTNASGTEYGTWDGNGTAYNLAIGCYCHHIGTSRQDHTKVEQVYFRIIDKWTDGDTTYFAMLMLTAEGFSNTGTHFQTLGGVVRFGVKGPDEKKASFTATKVWSDNNNSMGVRPSSVTVDLVRNDGTTVKTETLSASNNWTVTWDDIVVEDGDGTYTYTIKEDAVANYTISYSGTDGAFSGNDTNGYTATVTNTLDTGFIRVKKESTMPEITNDNGCYSLSGAKFGVYKEQNCTTKVGDLTTTTTGYSNVLELLPGDYWIKEITAPTGFELNSTPVKVTVTADSTADSPSEGTVKNKPKNDPMAIQITKIWNGPKTDTVPSLEGTQFTVKYYPGYYDTAAQVSALTPKRTWVIEVKKSSSGKYMTQLSETYRVGGDEFYKNANGNVIIPLGTITIQETKAAPGYTLDGEFMDANRNTFSPKDVYVTQVKDENSMVKVQGGNEYSAEDDPKPATIRIKKVDSKGNALSGVEFTITDKDGNAVTDMSGDAINTVTTDASGIAEFSNLYSDIYLITETKTVSGQQLLKEPITVYAPMRMTQQDATDNNLDTSKAYWDDSENCYLIFEQTFEVSNTATFDMPMSGNTFDSRMMIPLGFGMVLLTGAFVLVFRKKRELM